MIKKLFGETDEEQFRYLKPRLTALGVGVAFLLIALLLFALKIELSEIFFTLGELICIIDLFVFGWAIWKGLFGFATLGALFSRNAVLAAVIIVLYIMVGYIGGFVVAVIGLCRFFVLLKKGK